MIIIMTMSMMIMVNMMAIMILKVLITNTRNMIGFATQFIIVTQVQQMKMFNAQFEKEISAEARKNRKIMEKVTSSNMMLMLSLLMISKIILRLLQDPGGRKSDPLETHFGRVERGEAG